MILDQQQEKNTPYGQQISVHRIKKVCVIQTITILNRWDFPIRFSWTLKAKARHLHNFFTFISIKHISNEVEVIIKSIAVHAWHKCFFLHSAGNWNANRIFIHLRAYYAPYQMVFIGHEGSTHNYKFKLIVSIEFEFYRIIPKMGRLFFPCFFIDYSAFELGFLVRMMQHEMKNHKLQCALRPI